MTPFDPVALVVMLLTFYPVVSVPALQLARAERPEYFAGGVLGGSKGEKLTLPDGRVFDLIYAAGGPPSAMRWQAIDVTDGGGGDADPWPLEDGPLTPLEETFVFPPRQDGRFESLVTRELEALGGADDVLQRAAQAVTELDGGAAIDAADARWLAPAREAHDRTRRAIEADDPGAELEAAQSTDSHVTATAAEYDEDEPSDIDGRAPDEGPTGGGGGDEPPPTTDEG